MKHFDTHLLSRQEIADGTMAFDFVKPDGFRFEAGNAVNLTLVDPPYTDGKGNTRTFSIASAPSEPGLVFATRMRGSAFKRTLKMASMGMRARLAEPGGAFTLDAADRRPAVFLTGGIGVTPFVSMSRQAAAEQLPRRIWLFHSNRRPEDAPVSGRTRGARAGESQLPLRRHDDAHGDFGAHLERGTQLH